MMLLTATGDQARIAERVEKTNPYGDRFGGALREGRSSRGFAGLPWMRR
jgi:hypothetical protein